MMSNSKLRVHGAAESSFSERRIVDAPELRLAHFTAPSIPSCIGVLRDRLTQSIEEFGILSDTHTNQICMALEEALANAFYHGNLELDSALKEDSPNRFSELANLRSRLDPWKDRRIKIIELATPIGLWVTIADEGTGFDVHKALNRTQNPAACLASGRGLVMMKAFTDELVFNPRGNEVTLVVYHNRNRDVVELFRERTRRQTATLNQTTTSS